MPEPRLHPRKAVLRKLCAKSREKAEDRKAAPEIVMTRGPADGGRVTKGAEETAIAEGAADETAIKIATKNARDKPKIGTTRETTTATEIAGLIADPIASETIVVAIKRKIETAIKAATTTEITIEVRIEIATAIAARAVTETIGIAITIVTSARTMDAMKGARWTAIVCPAPNQIAAAATIGSAIGMIAEAASETTVGESETIATTVAGIATATREDAGVVEETLAESATAPLGEEAANKRRAAAHAENREDRGIIAEDDVRLVDRGSAPTFKTYSKKVRRF